MIYATSRGAIDYVGLAAVFVAIFTTIQWLITRRDSKRKETKEALQVDSKVYIEGFDALTKNLHDELVRLRGVYDEDRQIWAKERNSLNDQVLRLRTDVEQCQIDRHVLSVELEQLKGQIKTLGHAVVTGSPSITREFMKQMGYIPRSGEDRRQQDEPRTPDRRGGSERREI